MKTPSPPRPGYTIFELVVVLAILLMLAAISLPSYEALYGNSKQRAAVDTVRTRIANARSKAVPGVSPP